MTKEKKVSCILKCSPFITSYVRTYIKRTKLKSNQLEESATIISTWIIVQRVERRMNDRKKERIVIVSKKEVLFSKLDPHLIIIHPAHWKKERLNEIRKFFFCCQIKLPSFGKGHDKNESYSDGCLNSVCCILGPIDIG